MLKSTRYYEDPYFFFCLLSFILQKNPPNAGFLVSPEGIEPSTNGLKGRCSTG